MGRVGRLAGAMLAETEGHYYLVGDLKEPCDWAGAGFADPGKIDPAESLYVRLQQVREVQLEPPIMTFDLEGESLAKLLGRRLVITRNGSVSERLWDLMTDEGDLEFVDAAWLGQMPGDIWDIVRDSVLRCL